MFSVVNNMGMGKIRIPAWEEMRRCDVFVFYLQFINLKIKLGEKGTSLVLTVGWKCQGGPIVYLNVKLFKYQLLKVHSHLTHLFHFKWTRVGLLCWSGSLMQVRKHLSESWYRKATRLGLASWGGLSPLPDGFRYGLPLVWIHTCLDPDQWTSVWTSWVNTPGRHGNNEPSWLLMLWLYVLKLYLIFCFLLSGAAGSVLWVISQMRLFQNSYHISIIHSKCLLPFFKHVVLLNNHQVALRSTQLMFEMDFHNFQLLNF